jgi:hypothetical protein
MYAECGCMSGIISQLAQALAGAQGMPVAVAPAVRRKIAAAGRATRGADEVIVDAEAIESSRGVRGLASNDQEDAREDHQEHETGEYSKRGAMKPRRISQIDLNG